MKLTGKELLNDAFPIIESFAPTIAGAIGGPVGLAIGYVVPLLSRAFNTNPNNLTQLITTIKTHPDSKNILDKCEEELGPLIGNFSQRELTSLEFNLKMQWANIGDASKT